MAFDDLVRRAPMVGPDFDQLERYYENEVRLDALGISLPPQARIIEMVAPFPKMAVDVLAEVLSPEGYLVQSDNGDAVTELLRTWWQANDLDTTCRMAITEALVQGEAFWLVSSDGDSVRVTAHSARGMAVTRDAMGGVAEALRLFKANGDDMACHYLPGENDYYVRTRSGLWKLVERRATGATRPAVVPMLNRTRLGDDHGRSEIREIVKISDAASRSLTNLQVAQELLSMPLRYIIGKNAGNQFGGDEGKKITAYFGHLLTGPEGAKIDQLAGADLSQIVNSYKLYAQQISAVTGIPPSMLGISTDNPSSAEAMRVAKERLITKAELKQEMFGDALEDVARLELEMMGESVEGLETLEMQWRDPATPSVSAQAANALQAQAQGVIGAETARDFMRLSPEQKARETARSRDVDTMTG